MDKPDETTRAVPYSEERVNTPMPPSLRRRFGHQARASKRERATKGIPPWRARKFYR